MKEKIYGMAKAQGLCFLKIKFCLAVVLAAFLLLNTACFSLVAHASVVQEESATRIVRVGVFDSPAYYGTNENGELSGYGYSYLNEIERVSSLRFEYVHGTREEHIANLNAGRIDLLDTIPYSDEYTQQFVFSKIPTVLSNGTLNVMSTNTQYSPEDYVGFDGMRIGVLENGIRRADFEQWAQLQGFGYSEYVFVDGYELFNAMLHGEVDAIVSDNIYYAEGQSIIANFHPTLYHFITARNKQEIMDEIDAATDFLLQEDPLLRSELSAQFLAGSENINALTDDERDYVQEIAETPLRVVYDANDAPFEYYDEEIGEATGLSVDVFEAMMETAGIAYEYVHTENRQAAVDAMNDGDADILLSHSSANTLPVNENFVRSVPYLSVPMALVGKDDELTTESVFVLEEGGTPLMASYLESHFPENEVVYCQDREGCYEAVQDGEQIFTLDNIYMAGNAVQSGDYGELDTLSTRLNESFSVMFAPHTEDLLVSIINKNIRSHGGQVGESLLLTHVSALSEQSELSRWWALYGSYVLGAGALVLLGAVLILAILLRKQRALRNELWNSAYVDSLTGLPNLRYFKKEAKELLAKNKNKQYLAVQVDFNQFRLLNDMYGQEECNHILKTMGKALSSIVKPESDIVARLRADNFLLLYAHDPDLGMDDLHGRDAGQVFAYMGKHIKHHLNYSIGRYQVPLGETDIDDVCEKVNYAHRQAKKEVSSEVVDYEEAARQQALRHRSLEEKMENALRNEEFMVYLQPKYSLTSGMVVGAETLVRWRDGGKGELISPGEFIPLFEQNGFVLQLDFYMFEKVCALLSQRLQDNLPLVPISVNFSRLHLQTGRFVENITEIANRYEVPRQFLEIELVESTVVDNEEVLEIVLKELHEAGFTLSIDDFGTGYSSLGLLKNLPVDVIKIDRSFFANNRSKVRARTVISNVLRMAKELNIRTVAEGVETQDHVNFLRGLGCESVQGFYFSRPVHVDEFNWGACEAAKLPKDEISVFSAEELGSLALGRGNLGEMMPVMVHRQLEFSIRLVLEQRFGERETVDILRKAGKISGDMFAEGYLDLTADFDQFVKGLKTNLHDQKIGDLAVESYDAETGNIVLTMMDDLTCSGVTDTRRTLCHYEEGFFAGVMQRYAKKPYTALEVDCWANGAQLCRFRVRPKDGCDLPK